jgi:hypothetical protein
MKKFTGSILMALALFTLGLTAEAGAAHEDASHVTGKTEMVTMYQCPMDQCTSKTSGKCPICGMNMEEKQMTAGEAQEAMDKTKDMMRKRS